MNKLGFVALAVLLFSGCSTLNLGGNLPPEEQVTLRAQAWADELLANDLEGAWKWTTPAYRTRTHYNDYNTEVAGARRWTSASVKSVQCEVDVCQVRMLVDYTIKQLSMSNQRHLDYKWILVDGKWWLYVG